MCFFLGFERKITTAAVPPPPPTTKAYNVGIWVIATSLLLGIYGDRCESYMFHCLCSCHAAVFVQDLNATHACNRRALATAENDLDLILLVNLLFLTNVP